MSYVTDKINYLMLYPISTESMMVKTFESESSNR